MSALRYCYRLARKSKLWNQSKLLEHHAYFGISIITVAPPQAIHGFIRVGYGFFKTASLFLKIWM